MGCGANQYMDQLCSSASMYDGQCKNCDLKCIGAQEGNPLAPSGQYKLVPCTGFTSANLVCANCLQNCPVGQYITDLCNGTGTSDTARCTPCTCPAGYYAPNATACTGTTTVNPLACIPCKNASSCQDGISYLSGQCSTFSNTACTPCRSQCKEAEVEARQCVNGTNRHCLPDVACFRDCPSGSYEKRACSPPNVRQVCAACTQCAAGFFVKTPCSRKSDTVCERCTSSVCISDSYNAQFGSLGGCQGTESRDTALCGTITESYGERCAPDSYRFRGRVPMPHSFWENIPPQHPALSADIFLNNTYKKFMPVDLAFDVHPARKVYAYCSGNAIFTYDYEGVGRGKFLDFAYLPEHCADIRFSSSGKYLMASSKNSSRLFRCDPQCLTSDAFVLDRQSNRYVCNKTHARAQQWGDGLRVHCIPWTTSFNTEELKLVKEGRSFAGGLQNFESVSLSSPIDIFIHASGSFFSTSAVSSWIWWMYADVEPVKTRQIYEFPAGIQIVGPVTYLNRNHRVFVPVHDHRNTSRRLIVYQLALTDAGTLDTNFFLGTGVSVLYYQEYQGVSSSLLGVIPSIPGFAARMDTGVLSLVDEQAGVIHVFPCTAYQPLDNLADKVCGGSGIISTPYNASTTQYKDLEYVGKALVDNAPSKLFLTSLTGLRAELYVQCAKCQGGGLTSTEKEALSESECFCPAGSMIVTSPARSCDPCKCKDGQYLDLQAGGVQMCNTGRELSMPGCMPCSATCAATGQFMQVTPLIWCDFHGSVVFH